MNILQTHIQNVLKLKLHMVGRLEYIKKCQESGHRGGQMDEL